MSVYTSVSENQLVSFLRGYAAGQLLEFQGIPGGITNTNYAVDTNSGQYVLTLFEHMSGSELDYILGLQHHLASRGVKCAAALKNRDGNLYSTLNNKPAALIHRVPGNIVTSPRVHHCALVGTELARFHLAGQDYRRHRPNPRGLSWWLQMRELLQSKLNTSDRQLLEQEISAFQDLPTGGLPGAAIHADLFHDNVLFDGEKIGGFIDFDYACNDFFIYDLAVTINDWCIDQNANIVSQRKRVLLEAYDHIRPLQKAEINLLPVMLRAAALRFWLSRLHDKCFPIPGELTRVKDPLSFREMLLLRVKNQTV